MHRTTKNKIKKYGQLALFGLMGLILLKVLIFNAAEILVLLLLLGIIFYLFYRF